MSKTRRALDPLKQKARSLTADRVVTAEPLLVAPTLIGARLASPWRRAMAMGLDLLAIALLTGVGGLWLVVAIAVLAWQLASHRGGVPRTRAMWLGWAAAALVLWLAASEAQQRWFPGSEGRAARAAAELDADASDDDEPAVAVSPVASAAAAATATGVTQGAAETPEAAASARIAALEVALAGAERKAARLAERKPKSVRAHLSGWLDEIGAGIGWGIVYFSLLPAWWQGQTLGKKLMRLRIVELAGQPITVMRALKRYGGYAAGLATGGIGLAQALWDPNRQALHDKAAHTVVLDERPPPPSTAPPTAPAENAEAPPTP